MFGFSGVFFFGREVVLGSFRVFWVWGLGAFVFSGGGREGWCFQVLRVFKSVCSLLVRRG